MMKQSNMVFTSVFSFILSIISTHLEYKHITKQKDRDACEIKGVGYYLYISNFLLFILENWC